MGCGASSALRVSARFACGREWRRSPGFGRSSTRGLARPRGPRGRGKRDLRLRDSGYRSSAPSSASAFLVARERALEIARVALLVAVIQRGYASVSRSEKAGRAGLRRAAPWRWRRKVREPPRCRRQRDDLDTCLTSRCPHRVRWGPGSRIHDRRASYQVSTAGGAGLAATS